MTTKTSQGYGMTTRETYINSSGSEIAGYMKGRTTGINEVHISPFYANGDIVDFRATVGHELTHAYHNYMYTGSLVDGFSESVAYKYTARVYFDAGRFQVARRAMQTALKLNYWQSYPAQYSIPGVMKFR